MKHLKSMTALGTAALLSATACVSSSPTPDEPGTTPNAAPTPLVQGAGVRLWTANGNTIPLCWETPGWELEKRWVESAILRTWSRAADLQVTFAASCPAPRTISDEAPFVRMAIGNHTDDSNGGGNGQARALGMDTLSWGYTALQFWFKPDHTANKGRVEYLAVHEFGHVLGFKHEQNQPSGRSCNVSQCASLPVGDQLKCINDNSKLDGGVPLGPYDANSIMNYCNRFLNMEGILSDGDIAAVQRAYGKPRFVLPDEESSLLTWDSGRVEGFSRSAEGHVLHLWGNGAPLAGQWWNPAIEDLGGSILGAPSAVMTGSGLVDVFALSAYGFLVHKRWHGSGWSPEQRGWLPLGGELMSPPVATSWGPDRADVFYVGTDGAIYHKARSGSQWLPTDGSPEFLGGQSTGHLAAVSWGPNRIDVFTIGADQGVWHKAWDGAGWYPSQEGWERLGGKASGGISAYASRAGRIDLAIRSGYTVMHKAWIDDRWLPNDSTTFTPLQGAVIGDPAVIATRSGPEVFAEGLDHGLYHWRGSLTRWPTPPEALFGQIHGRPAVTVTGYFNPFMHVLERGADDGLWWTGARSGAWPAAWYSTGANVAP